MTQNLRLKSFRERQPRPLFQYMHCVCDPGEVSPSEERMQVGLEELQDLKGVWAELAKIWEQIDDMKEKPWLSVQPRKVRFSKMAL